MLFYIHVRNFVTIHVLYWPIVYQDLHAYTHSLPIVVMMSVSCACCFWRTNKDKILDLEFSLDKFYLLTYQLLRA